MRINQSGASAAYLSAAVSKVSRFHAATILMLVAFDGLTLSPCYWPALATRDGTAGSALQIIFSFEPRSDLLDHFATIGVVH